LIARNGVAESRAQEYIRGEMRKCGDARKANSSREAVHRPRYPVVRVISGCDHGGDREGSGRVSRGKTAPFERRFAAGKKCVTKVPCRKHVRGTLSACDGLNSEVNYGSIRVSLAR